MSHSRSSRSLENEERRKRAEADAQRIEKRKRAELYAEHVLRAFNATCQRGKVPAFFPTVRCRIVAEQTRLETVCPGCGIITHSHVEKFDCHPLTTVAWLLFKVGCPRCGDNAPIVRVTKISSWSYDARNTRWGMGHAHYKRAVGAANQRHCC